nr:DUF423 domain-containing protein [Luteirhabdus pelagi]
MTQIQKKILVTAAILGAITVIIGAFGAHGLKKLVDDTAVSSFETGVRYQMYHVFALLFLGMVTGISEATQKWVFRLFLLGVLLFSGSIYLLALQDVVSFTVSFLGPITPIGGSLLIIGWFRLAWGLYSLK